jgi:site-specific recombinase XerD
MSSLPATVTPISETAPVWGWVRVRSLVLDSVSSPHSRRAYAKALDAFRDWCQESGRAAFTRETVQRYRAHLEARGLAASSLNLHLTVIRKLAHEGAAHGILPYEAAASITGVKGARQKGLRLGTWLTLEQACTLLQAPAGDGLRVRRDRALLAVLLGCGLRRSELAALTCDRIQQREGRWVLVDVEGKGSRIRSVPMPAWAKAAIDQWTGAAGIAAGRLFRALSQREELGEGLTAQAVYLVVRGYAEQLGIDVAPHDLRRTFAKLAHRGRSPVEQIQLSLGHESILTTERYLGIRQSLTDAPCDHLGIELENV